MTKTFKKDELGVPPIERLGFEATPRIWRYPPEKSLFRSRRRFFYPEEFIDFPNYMDWAYRLVKTMDLIPPTGFWDLFISKNGGCP